MYIYIYIYREREREREMCVCVCVLVFFNLPKSDQYNSIKIASGKPIVYFISKKANTLSINHNF